MKFLLACAAASLISTAAQAAPQIQQVIYNVDAASKCSAAANDQAALKDGLEACTIALKDPAMNHRAALLLDRGWHTRPLVLYTDHVDDLPLIRISQTTYWFGTEEMRRMLVRDMPQIDLRPGLGRTDELALST